MVIGLVVDLVVGVDGGGSQVWLWQEELFVEVNVGVLLDIFNQFGQDWGVFVFNFEGLCCYGYWVFCEMLWVNLVWFGGLCIDYVMGL